MNERMISYWFLLSSIFFLSVIKEIGYVCLIISLICYWKEKKEKGEKNTIDWLVIAYLVVTVFSGIFNWSNDYVHHGRLLKGVQTTIIGLTYYFLVKHYVVTKQEMKNLVMVFLGQGMLLAGYGIWEYLVHDAERIMSASNGPNLLATQLNVFLGFYILYFLETEKWQQKVLTIVGIILLLTGLLLTFSRGGWLAFCVLFLGILLWQSKKIFPWLMGGCFFIALFAFSGIRERAISIFTVSDVSSLQRFYIWDAAWKMIQEHPIWGIGAGQYRYLYDAFVQPGSPIPDQTFSHAHNILVNIFCERGFLAIAVFLLLLGFVFASGYQFLKKKGLYGDGSNIVIVCLLAIMTICVTGMFDDSFALHSNFYLLMMLFALVQRKKE